MKRLIALLFLMTAVARGQSINQPTQTGQTINNNITITGGSSLVTNLPADGTLVITNLVTGSVTDQSAAVSIPGIAAKGVLTNTFGTGVYIENANGLTLYPHVTNAFNASMPGDIIHLGSNTWVFTSLASGSYTTASNVTVRGIRGQSVIIATPTAGSGSGVTFNNSNVVDGVTFAFPSIITLDAGCSLNNFDVYGTNDAIFVNTVKNGCTGTVSIANGFVSTWFDGINIAASGGKSPVPATISHVNFNTPTNTVDGIVRLIKVFTANPLGIPVAISDCTFSGTNANGATTFDAIHVQGGTTANVQNCSFNFTGANAVPLDATNGSYGSIYYANCVFGGVGNSTNTYDVSGYLLTNSPTVFTNGGFVINVTGGSTQTVVNGGSITITASGGSSASDGHTNASTSLLLGGISTTQTSYTNINSLAVTFVCSTNGSTEEIGMSSSLALSTVGSATVNLRILVDGVSISGGGVKQADWSAAESTLSKILTPVWTVSGLTAGSHTVQVQWETASGTTVSFTNNSGNSTDLWARQL